MSESDTDFLLKTWKELCQNQTEIIVSLSELVEAQRKTIVRLTLSNGGTDND